jgi:hypothetical protein
MSSYYERLLYAIERSRTKDVRIILEEMSLEDEKSLLWGKASLLDEAASRSKSAIMAFLIQNGVTKWFGSQENNRVFIRLIDDYLVNRKFGNFLQSASYSKKSWLETDEEPTTKRHKQGMNVLKHKDNPADATKAIQDLLKSQEQWLISLLRGRALVRNTSKIIGSNISWYIKDGVLRACDHVTGRKFNHNQVLFEKPVKLVLCGKLREEEKEWIVDIEGTTKEVLEKIYFEYKPMFKDMGDEMWFEGLSKVLMGKHKGKYFLHLGS